MRSAGRWAGLSLAPWELALAGVLLAVAAVAWAATILRMAGMTGMDAGLWSAPADLGPYLGAWVPMMTAMMLPSIVPAAVQFDRAIRSQRGRRIALAHGVVFAGGYLVVWATAGAVPFAVLRLASAFAGSAEGRYLAAGVIVVAAAYQLAPQKDACLRRLRVRPGGAGALRAGLECGAWCLGCCWALMASLVALGLMSLPWMVLIWALVMGERLLPSPRVAALGIAAVLVSVAVCVLTGIAP
jgi:predicted metal-binding membrane protein